MKNGGWLKDGEYDGGGRKRQGRLENEEVDERDAVYRCWFDGRNGNMEDMREFWKEKM